MIILKKESFYYTDKKFQEPTQFAFKAIRWLGKLKPFVNAGWVFYFISTEYLLVGLNCTTFGLVHLHFHTHEHPRQLNTPCQICIDFFLYLCIPMLCNIYRCTSCRCVVAATLNCLFILSGIHSVHQYTSSYVHAYTYICMYVLHSCTSFAESIWHPFICICI